MDKVAVTDINTMKSLIMQALQNYYTRGTAYNLAVDNDLVDFLELQCKRYSLDITKVKAQALHRKMTIARAKEYAKSFADL